MCKARYMREYYHANKNRRTDTRFGLAKGEYERMVEEQDGKCANPGCRTPAEEAPYGRLVVDHDNGCCPAGKKRCGKCVRGLLCDPCNKMLGFGFDSPEKFRGAADYLEEYKNRISPAG